MAIFPLKKVITLGQTLIKRLLPLLLGVLAFVAVLLMWQKLTINEQLQIEQVIHQSANASEPQRVEGFPSPPLIAKEKSPLPILVLMDCLVLIWLFVLVLYLTQVSYRQIHRFKQVNRQLKREIQQRKQAEISMARLAAIVESSEDAIISKDLEGIITSWNIGAEKIFGYTASEIVGKSISGLIPVECQDEETEILQKIQRGDHIRHYDTKRLKKDGALIDVSISISPIKDQAGNIIGASKIARNIAERKQAEADIREMSEVLGNAVSGISKLDTQGYYLYVNKAYAEIAGYQPEEMIGMPWQKTVDPDELEKMIIAYQQMVQEGRVEVETKGIRKDGSVFYKQLVMIATYDQQHQLLGHYCFMKDISDQKRKELALRQAMKAAEAANLAKSIFLANMSHELRTPLNVILGFAQVMAHDSSLTPSQQQDLQTIRRSGDHLLSLINDVLDLSKIESGHCTVEESGFDLMALLHSLRNMLAERASSKGLDLYFEIGSEVPQFMLADAQKLRQILLNLLSNAIKFTDQGGITLRVSMETPARETIPTKRPILQFVVTDTGVGIAPEELDTIFDAFVQAQAGKRSASGTGLGLTISRKLLKLMGGEISVSSILGGGSTFAFTLPVSPASGVNITSEQSDRLVIGLARGQPHHRILVVDDRAENRLLIVRLLTQLGLEVREATNGQEAVQIWQKWLPDLTWMDIRMPVLNGYEATKQIRAIEGGQNSIIIALTAQASQSDRALALAAGCNDYISKPFREQTLFLKMAEYLGLEYIYQEEGRGNREQGTDNSSPFLSSVSSPVSDALDLTPLATLSEVWLAQLEDAAVCGNDGEIAKLVAQLPPELARLGSYLIQLADQYQFEQILRLLQANSPTLTSASKKHNF